MASRLVAPGGTETRKGVPESVIFLFQTLYNLKQTSPAIGLVLSLPYAALPKGFFIMFFLTLEEFLGFAGLNPKRESR